MFKIEIGYPYWSADSKWVEWRADRTQFKPQGGFSAMHVTFHGRYARIKRYKLIIYTIWPARNTCT